ncbi:hypothetical protein HD554DRAFT_233268 [Boletus coccyginus]|nr:hypothetical protein HD554DRAFT_233268 [Boletus coccyginus]
MGQPNWSSRNRPNRPHIATVFTVHRYAHQLGVSLFHLHPRTRHLGVNIDTVARTPGVPTRSTSLPLSNRIRPLARETRAWCPLRSTPLRPGSTHPHTALGSKQHEPPPYPSPARSVLALTTPRDRESYAIRFNTPASSLLAAVSASTLCIFDLFHSTMGVGRELWVPLKSRCDKGIYFTLFRPSECMERGCRLAIISATYKRGKSSDPKSA